MTSCEDEFPHIGSHDVGPVDFPIAPDNLSEWENAVEPQVLAEFDDAGNAPEVRLRGKSFSFLSVPGENVPEYVIRDCTTLSSMELRAKYAYTANSHRKTLERAPTRGHFVNPVWHDFRDFLRSQGPRLPGTTLHRVNNDDPEYGPGKCVWASPKVQNNSKGDTLEFIHSVTGEKWKSSELAARDGVSVNAIEKRHARGWSPDKIIERRRCPKFLQAPARLTAQAPADELSKYVQLTSKLPISKGATKHENLLADLWEPTMRELTPTPLAPLTGKERGRLRAFGDYLGECNMSHDKAGVLDFILRNWTRAARYVGDDAGKFIVPTTPSPDFVADHARRIVNFVLAFYKPVKVEDLHFYNEPEKPVSASQWDAVPVAPAAEWLADHPVTFDEYMREVWTAYRIVGSREAYEAGVVRCVVGKPPRPDMSNLRLLPVYVQEIVIRRAQLALDVVEPPPADPNNPPDRFCPITSEIIAADLVEHSDPFPWEQNGSEAPSALGTATLGRSEMTV